MLDFFSLDLFFSGAEITARHTTVEGISDKAVCQDDQLDVT